MTDSCPITEAIRTIRGGDPCDEHDDSRVVVIGGGNSGNHGEYVCDDVAYYISRRRLEFARYNVAKLNNVSVPEPVSYAGKTLRDVAGAIIAELPSRLYDQMVSVCDVISRLEDLIQRRVLAKPVTNITLCHLCESVFAELHDDPRLLFNPINAYKIAVAICSHVSCNDINVMLTSPCEIHPQSIPEFEGVAPQWDTIVPVHDHLEVELAVAAYIRDVEAYHCVIIQRLSVVYAYSDDILSKFKR